MTIKRIEIHGGPDGLGRYSYTLFWWADYHPGHPDGEHARRERAQEFFGALPEWAKVVKTSRGPK